MSDTTKVIVTIRGWDGHRVVGVFDSIEKAISVIEDSPPSKLTEEEFLVDVVKENSVSSSVSIVYNSDVKKNYMIREHCY